MVGSIIVAKVCGIMADENKNKVEYFSKLIKLLQKEVNTIINCCTKMEGGLCDFADRFYSEQKEQDKVAS